MNIDMPTFLILFPILTTAILGFLQYRTNSRLADINKERAVSQNIADTLAGEKSMAEAYAIVSKGLAEAQERIANLENANKNQRKYRMVLELDLGEKPHINTMTIERIGTGPLNGEKAKPVNP